MLFAAGKDFFITRALSGWMVGALAFDWLRLQACLKKIMPSNILHSNKLQKSDGGCSDIFIGSLNPFPKENQFAIKIITF